MSINNVGFELADKNTKTRGIAKKNDNG